MDRLVYDANGTLVTPDLIVRAYESRCFPMAEDRGGLINWYRPQTRAILTWDRWKVPRSLAKTARREPYRLSYDEAFEDIIAACADRDETWISQDIEALYGELHRRGIAHSVEAWDHASGDLVGGLYGLCIGGCFCGESMFHREPDASKLCVIHLVERLQRSGFAVLDCQQQTPHMERFGAYEVDDGDYAELLYQHLEHRVF